MMKYTENMDLDTVLKKERLILEEYINYETNIRKNLRTFIREFSNVDFENDILKTIILNNLDNAITQVKSNIQDLKSLESVLEIIEKQDSVTEIDIETYNKLFNKSQKDIDVLQNFIQQTVSCFENVPFTGAKKSLTAIDKCKQAFVDTSFKDNVEEINKKYIEENKPEKKQEESKPEAEEVPELIDSRKIKVDFDYSSSDLLCFFPKDKSDNLVISTVQDSYRILFNENVASISIEKDNFNFTLNTCGVQISSTKTNNILFVRHSEPNYIIITNNEIEIPPSIQVSKISKNDDFLEVEISGSSINLIIKNNKVYIEDASNNVINTPKSNKPKNDLDDFEDDEYDDDYDDFDDDFENEPIDDFINNSEEDDYEELAPEPIKKAPEAAPSIIEVPTKKSRTPKHIRPDDDEIKNLIEETENKKEEPKKSESVQEPVEITDNDTLIISDSNKNVILPYTVEDLEKKLQNNKKYKTLQDVINAEYTIPIETYKNPVKSRFKEAFHLIKKKEHGSLKEAIGLGFELMFQSDLNPAVIAACKDLDELDIYLDCLDDNELDKFSCFKISYNVPPSKA